MSMPVIGRGKSGGGGESKRVRRLGLTIIAILLGGGLVLLGWSVVYMPAWTGSRGGVGGVLPGTLPGKPNIGSGPACADTCPKANDGVCNEGRHAEPGGPAVAVECDLGTDCSDCGPWGGHLPRWDGEESGPIAFALSKGMVVQVKATATEPRYLQPITLKERDPDVSAMLDNYGALEGGVMRVVHEILGAGQCVGGGGARELVLDVGANFGVFALYAAAEGCRVIAWEPVDTFRAFLHHGIALNNLTHLVTVRNAAVSDASNQVTIGVPKDGTYYGLASVDNLNLQPNEVARTITVKSERLDAVVKVEKIGRPRLLKIDVEGYEPQVLRSAARVLPLIEHILTEHSPGIFERSRNFTALRDASESLQSLLRAGFVAAHLPLRFATPWPPKLMPDHYKDPLPWLEEVTLSALALDIRQASMREQIEGNGAQHLGCPIPEELKRFPVWAGCNEWAYAAHPKSFRSALGFNTNVWLTRGVNVWRAPSSGGPPDVSLGPTGVDGDPTPAGVMKLWGQASLFAPGQDLAKAWASDANKGQSSGFMACDGLGASHQIIFHCPCTKPEVCGEEAKVVQSLMAQGKMPMQGWETEGHAVARKSRRRVL
ncbi:hypothetical protein FOA52_010182 [Chlamydomonas sp. UWO 241]|nr:hypothetical protein FOA52_010182 [Chlamydomonas sp. UWO 241]